MNIEINDMYIDYFKKVFTLLNADIINNNPYVKGISFANKTSGEWTFSNDTYEAFEPFVFNSHVVDENNYYQEIPQIGFFDKKVNYPVIKQKDNMCMSVTPNEINTMMTPIKNAKGKCITFGLGLGYYVYMLSNKEEVESITVIEIDDITIKLFKEEILPHFSHPEKVVIKKYDAFEYMKNVNLNQYDHIFVDIHHDASDGLDVYMKCLSLLGDNKFDFWIEDSIILLVRKMIISELYDYYYDEHTPYYDYQFIYAGIKLLLKEEDIFDYEQIKTLISDESIKNILKKISLYK